VAPGNAYDEMPYESHPFRASHPYTMATAATLLGMTPAPLTGCRVLELGCASGGNILPMAVQMPGSTFLGIDLSARQIGHGKTLIEATGLKNVELRQASIMDVDERFGQFDYIVAHGVFSWVPNDVQEKMLSLCAERLTPQGIAYISYNTYPGWHMQGMLRDMMVYHAQRFPEPAMRVQQARALLDFLVQSVPAENNAYGMMLKQSAAFLKDAGDYYLAHDHLEAINEPVYFHQFVERAQARGLQYLGESHLGMMAACNFPAEIQQKLFALSSNDIEIEQFMDFVRNRTFRQTLLCHKNIVRTPQLKPEILTRLYLSSPSRPTNPQGPNLAAGASEQFSTASKNVTTQEPLLKAAFLRLSESFPKPLSFDELSLEALQRLGRPASDDSKEAAADVELIGRAFLQCYLTSDLIELHSYAPPMTLQVSERPTACPLARLQTRFGPKVTNRRHELVTLDTFGRYLLPFLNGGNTVPTIVGELMVLARTGELQMHEGGKPVQDEKLLRERFAVILKESLPRLARLALLVA
jgi:methyltransferase-like protein/cyclopropane fatty-acyl-phospholipid synthase-like methyltransferase